MIDQVLKRIERLEKEWKCPVSSGVYAGKTVGLWSISRSTGEFLSFLVSILKPKTVFEVGCASGYSTLWMVSEGSKIYTTEIVPEKVKLAEQNFKDAKVDVEILGDATEVLKKWDEEIDFVFLDGNKSEYLKQYELIIPLLSSNGLIVVDNVESHSDRLVEFVKRVKEDSRVVSIFVNGLLVIQKR